LGGKIPGVSIKIIWDCSRMVIPKTRVLVVWTFDETIETLAPTIQLISVDLPTLGAPIKAKNPQLVLEGKLI
jgi:hypothetical protein